MNTQPRKSSCSNQPPALLPRGFRPLSTAWSAPPTAPLFWWLRNTGERSAVAVWTVQQLVAFLGYVADDRLYAMWWLIALRGLRRGEAAGLRWTDVDPTTGSS